ncbi:MAG: SpoIID/LytB domain-containing protein [Candidatus Eremiobacteraeota bacterium]|nr:SpoIID/LytB domain-containing protein [Candidatus Eremiobacteraeota bacterium]
MQRRAFVASLGAAVVVYPRVASATGGHDVGGAVTERPVRVLLASGDATGSPRQLDAWHFGWNGRTYRGTFTYVTLADGKRGLVNVVPLDAYLYGVLSAEVSPGWPHASQEAQAIVARTYALTKLRPSKPYDVVATESDQRYGGIESESVEGHAAVDATAGQIVSYNGAPANVAFSACCGGRTADSGDVWGSPRPYLRSVADPHCADTPDYRWQTNISYDSVQRALELARAGDLRDVQLKDVDPSGRPRFVNFVGSAATVQVASQAFRFGVGAAVVRSTYLRSVGNASGSLAVAGNGRGHGVGMCQWGARSMGASGATAAQIVAFYFPSTTVG